MTSQFPDTTSSPNFFNVVLFLLPSLVTGSSFISLSSVVLELWQFTFIRVWPEIRKSEIQSPVFCPISEDWGKLRIPNLAQTSPIKVTKFCKIPGLELFSELLRKNQQGGLVKLHHLSLFRSPTQTRVKIILKKSQTSGNLSCQKI